MFGLVEASAWMHVRNGTIKIIELLGSESDPVPVSLLTFSAGREKVKSPQGRNIKLQLLIKLQRAQRSPKAQTKKDHPAILCCIIPLGS